MQTDQNSCLGTNRKNIQSHAMTHFFKGFYPSKLVTTLSNNIIAGRKVTKKLQSSEHSLLTKFTFVLDQNLVLLLDTLEKNEGK